MTLRCLFHSQGGQISPPCSPPPMATKPSPSYLVLYKLLTPCSVPFALVFPSSLLSFLVRQACLQLSIS